MYVLTTIGFSTKKSFLRKELDNKQKTIEFIKHHKLHGNSNEPGNNFYKTVRSMEQLENDVFKRKIEIT